MKTLYKTNHNEEKFRGIFNLEEFEDAMDNVDVSESFMSLGATFFGEDFLNIFKETLGVDIDGVKSANNAVEEEVDDKDDKNDNQNNQNLDLDYIKNDKLHAQEAYNLLNRSIIVRSSKYGIVRPPEVAPRQDPKGTSLEGIRQKTILGINELQKKLNIPLVITGGTEAGHAGGLSNQPGTHGDGSKVDISFDNEVEKEMDQYITSKKPVVSDTKIGKKYKFEDGGYTYTIIKEKDHYDIKIS